MGAAGPATSGNDSSALAEVILAEGQTIRLIIAAHVESQASIRMVEQAVWTTACKQLPQRDKSVALREWLRWIVVERTNRHLMVIDREAITDKDSLTHQVAQECMDALSDGRDLAVTTASERLRAATSDIRDLLRRRYADGDDLERLAIRTGSTREAMASALAVARSACDWHPAVTSKLNDQLLGLVEGWLAGELNVDSRNLLVSQMARNLTLSSAIVRHLRLHLVLATLHRPMTADDALELAQQVNRSDIRDQASSYRGQANPRPASDQRRAGRGPSSPKTDVVEPPKPSPLPMILMGGVVFIGIVMLVLLTRDGAVESEPFAPGAVPDPPTSSANPPPNASAATPSTSALRPEFGGRTPLTPSDGTLALTWIGDALATTSHAGEALLLNVEVTRPDLVAAIDFHAGDRLLATITKAPYTWEWREPEPFSGELRARAIAQNGATLATIRTPMQILSVEGGGKLLREWWIYAPGRKVSEGLRIPSYPARPIGAVYAPAFTARRDWGDRYLQRLRGYVVPPMDGAYTFWISADEEAELWLSKDETPMQVRRIAICSATKDPAVAFGKWDERQQQRSQPQMLKAGKRYYVEALHKEDTGLDHVAVGWQLPDGKPERPISSKHLAPPDEALSDGRRGTLVFTTGFEDVVINKPSPHFGIDEKVASAVAIDSDAAEGRRFLQMKALDDLQDDWIPAIYRPLDFPNNTLRMSFSLRLRESHGVAYGWRQIAADQSIISGPRFVIEANGVLSAAGRNLTSIPMNTWIRFTVTAKLGPGSVGTWDLAVEQFGGTAQTFTGLKCDKNFRHLEWMGFSLKKRFVCDLDSVTMHLID